jgi:hypothetical protein
MRMRIALAVCSVVALGAFGMQAQDVGHAAAMKQAGIATLVTCLHSAPGPMP